DVGHVAPAALADRRLRRCLLVRPRMMAEGEESPAIRFREPLAVLHRHVDAVELAVEEAASGWFLAGTVWKSWIAETSQRLHADGSFTNASGLSVRVAVLPLDLDVVILGNSRHAVVESVGRERRADENPFAEAGRQFDFSVGQEHGGWALTLGG